MASVILLDAPEARETITHLKMARMNWEVDRPQIGKDGFLEFWFAYAYKNGDWVEPLHEGIHIKIEGAQFQAFVSNHLEPVEGEAYSAAQGLGLLPAGTIQTY